jgi:tight adherence protein B
MRKRRLFSLIAAALLWSPLVAEGVAHASGANSIVISEVDARDSNNVGVRVVVDDPSDSYTSADYGFGLRENGSSQQSGPAVNVLEEIAAGRISRKTVIIIDSSLTTARDDSITQAKMAATQFADALALGKNDEVSIVGAGAFVTRFGFSDQQADIDANIDGLKLSSGRSMEQAVKFGLGELGDVDANVKNLVIFGAGAGTDQTEQGLKDIRETIAAENVNVYIGGYRINGASDPLPLKEYVVANHGAYRQANDASEIATLGSKVTNAANNQWLLNYPSSVEDGVMKITVSLDGKTSRANTNTGTDSIGTDLQTQFSKPPSWLNKVPMPSPELARIIIAMLVLGFVGMVIWVVFTVVDRRGSLEAALRPYSDRKIDPDEESELHLETALMRRAIEVTEDIARERGLLNRIEEKLYQADLSINAAEFLFLAAAVTVIGAGFAFALEGWVAAIGAFILALLGVPAFLNFKAARRKRAFEKQLPDALQLLAGTLKAGYSLSQGLDATSQQVDDPLGKELRQAMAEAQLGRPLEDALDDIAERVNSPDFKWTVMAIKIQREVGGNLSEVLRNVAQTMIDRERLRREVNALTAEGRLSAVVLTIMPPGMGLYLWFTNPEYLHPLFADSLGRLLLGFGAVGMIGGIIWLKKMLKLEL